jgi:pantoate--beta-alanine ligase
MKIVKTTDEMQILSQNWDAALDVGFVPTMGYLHEGHLSLVKKAKSQCRVVIVSIYVNPAQFGPSEDLSSYPRDLDRDLALLEPLGVDYVFLPTNQMMYPEGYKTWIEVNDISAVLCGASRPGHFIGVATIVLKLVHLTRPGYMYMGEKDFQQIAVLRTMLQDLNVCTQIVPCPIVRESDGLALSSRNVYLSPEERKQALCLYRSITLAQNMYQSGVREPELVKTALMREILSDGARIDYVSIVNPEDLQECSILDDDSRLIMAVYLGKTRLIDNSALLA